MLGYAEPSRLWTRFEILAPSSVCRALRLTLLSLHQAVDHQSDDFARVVSIRHALDEDNEDTILPLTVPSRGLPD
jgi:hypothetical protein